MKTTVTEDWAIGAWCQRDGLTYVSRDTEIDGLCACNCVQSGDVPSQLEAKEITGGTVIYKQFDSGRSPIFRTTIVEE